MSCNYADGLSPYENKGILGLPEQFDSPETVEKKCAELVDWMLAGRGRIVVHTGAGVSTSAGIPDFRGPKGVWTLEEKGEKPTINVSFNHAKPTKTHMALRALTQHGYVRYIVSQNIDGLHLKSGLSRHLLAELHGNMFVDQCNKCRRQFVRKTAAETVGQKPCGGRCRSGEDGRVRACRGGLLLDNVLDWEADLPERDLDMALMHSTLAAVNITLGTTLQIIPSGNLPLKNKKYGGKLIICNLQPTKHDKHADLRISTYVDDILEKVCKRLGVEIPVYDVSEDPTKASDDRNCDWTISAQAVKEVEKEYNATLKEHKKQRKSLSKSNDKIEVVAIKKSKH
ncbi:PREDICTED: NAD-dependent protein deacetylase Sirt6-like isoform X1 [Rhagoletis zephyria]|uniref:NAD-dependent protein deacetylase Sirt6-like isoform X1 n=3 Tax=Rhagoletis zephyria TaxID=28612 RepID=UPI0008112D3B|nr:PREDICTED: NAD-dependent protein deacetylase Sirt6-like isoform X1 [Rhagoletis zephyria]